MEKMFAMPLKNNKIVILCIIASFFLYICVLTSTSASEQDLTTEYFYKNILFVGVDENGNIISNAKITVDLITSEGKENLFTGHTSNGFSLRSYSLPLKYITTLESDGMPTPIYESVNILVRINNGNSYGQYAFAVDPTRPEQMYGLTSIKVLMIAFNDQNWAESKQIDTRFNSKSLMEQPTLIMEYAYADTQVLSFGLWQNMQMDYAFVVGAKIRVESKWRLFPYGSWYSGGYTEVTIDNGWGPTSPLSGNVVWKIWANLKYADDINPVGQGTTQTVYAVNTGNDPYAHSQNYTSWGGALPSSNPDNYFLTAPNTYTTRWVTGGYDYRFSASVSLSYPPGGVSVGLGVTTVPSNPSWIKVIAGSALPGKTNIKTVSDGDTTFRSTYSNWIP